MTSDSIRTAQTAATSWLACVTRSFFAARPLVFAHRGGGALAPENTLAAFDNGLALGADGLELDVRLSRDGVVVVHHDRDARSARRCAARCRSIGPRRRRGLCAQAERAARSPTCWRAIRDVRVIIEMKVNRARARARASSRSCAGPDAVDRVCLGSFGRRVPAGGAHARAGDRDQRGARRGALGAVSLVVPVAASRASPTAATRCPNARGGRASSRRVSSTLRTRPASACRSGRSNEVDAARRLSGGASTR